MTEITGLKELVAQLRKLGTTGAKKIAGSAINAGLAVMTQAVAAASPGTVSQEVGSRQVRSSGPIVSGKVGLNVAGRRGPKTPHGHFLAAGTKFIHPSPFVKNAIASAQPTAMAAMDRAADKALKKFS